jgi:pyruvate,water dikinase
MFTLPFGQLTAKDTTIAGGKGASLGEMTQAGIPVPSGFVILASTFDRFIDAAGLAQKIEGVLGAVDPKQAESVQKASEQIQIAVLGAAMPAEIAAEIGQGFKALNAEYVAVRSSATAEDLETASFAGQQDTLLNITGTQRVIAAIRSCWASLYSPRAILYRAQRPELATGDLAMAVVVQVLVPARVAGVMFSANPQTGDPAEVVIEGSWGLGEAVVSGLVTPDRFVVDKRTGRTTTSRVAQKTVRVARCATGTVDEPVPAAYQGLPCLTATDRRELAQLATRVEESFGAPQDIEWAIDDAGARFVLQARPVTTGLSVHTT